MVTGLGTVSPGTQHREIFSLSIDVSGRLVLTCLSLSCGLLSHLGSFTKSRDIRGYSERTAHKTMRDACRTFRKPKSNVQFTAFTAFCSKPRGKWGTIWEVTGHTTKGRCTNHGPSMCTMTHCSCCNVC